MRRIAETGKPAEDCDWITYTDYHKYADDYELGEFIKEEMSQSRCVVLRGYPYQGVSFGASHFWRTFKIPEDQVFSVSGTFFIFYFTK